MTGRSHIAGIDTMGTAPMDMKTGRKGHTVGADGDLVSLR